MARDPAATAGIHALPVPTPFAVGDMNAYLIEDDPLTLIDSGPNSATALVSLTRQLAERGHRVEDLERLVVTHQHPDHIGLLGILAEISGAEIVTLDVLGPWLANYDVAMETDDRYAEEIMLESGVPPDVVRALRTVARLARAWGAPAQTTTSIRAGDVLGFAGREFQVLHRPGHSPTDTVFHDTESGVLIAGDHLLSKISSNPLLTRPPDLPVDALVDPRPQALITYVDSLRKTHDMDLSIVLGGHGPPVDDHRTLVDERLRATARRADKIAGLIGDHPQTAYEIAQSLWGNVAITQAYLTISEVLGHVDLLLEDGRVTQRMVDGVTVFSAA
jgi:glyoxylase-like metal-dependent hydrolase (beta-lactamase superfamily II)